MSEFVEVKAAELTGPALDWAMGQVEGVPCYTDPNSPQKTQFVDDEDCPFGRYIYSPRQNWDQGGPLRDKYKVDITEGEHAVSASILTESCECVDASGATALIALCRAIVSAKLGNVVQVPAYLVGVGA